MQCKPVTALPADQKWTFEIKFDGYRCIAVEARAGDHAILTSREGAQQALFQRRRGARFALGATSFSMGSWSPWTPKGDLPFTFCKTNRLGRFQFISMPSIC
jgi:hypothetical protein